MGCLLYFVNYFFRTSTCSFGPVHAVMVRILGIFHDEDRHQPDNRCHGCRSTKNIYEHLYRVLLYNRQWNLKQCEFYPDYSECFLTNFVLNSLITSWNLQSFSKSQKNCLKGSSSFLIHAFQQLWPDQKVRN